METHKISDILVDTTTRDARVGIVAAVRDGLEYRLADVDGEMWTATYVRPATAGEAMEFVNALYAESMR